MRAFPIFTVLFLVIPIIEIYFLIKVGEVIGAWPTIFLVVATAVIGAALLRQQGLSTLARLQSNMSQGKIPAQEMVEGVLLAVGGALLMTPGFVTDAIGFLCLLPFSRKFIAGKIMERSAISINARMGGFAQGASHHSPFESEADIFEGEFTEVQDDPIVISHKNNKDNK